MKKLLASSLLYFFALYSSDDKNMYLYTLLSDSLTESEVLAQKDSFFEQNYSSNNMFDRSYQSEELSGADQSDYVLFLKKQLLELRSTTDYLIDTVNNLEVRIEKQDRHIQKLEDLNKLLQKDLVLFRMMVMKELKDQDFQIEQVRKKSKKKAKASTHGSKIKVFKSLSNSEVSPQSKRLFNKKTFKRDRSSSDFEFVNGVGHVVIKKEKR